MTLRRLRSSVLEARDDTKARWALEIAKLWMMEAQVWATMAAVEDQGSENQHEYCKDSMRCIELAWSKIDNA